MKYQRFDVAQIVFPEIVSNTLLRNEENFPPQPFRILTRKILSH